MSAAAKPPAGRADHKEGKFPKVPEEWNIELPGRGADRFAQDAFFGGCRSIEKGYAKGEVLGHGTYGEVFLATDYENGDKVAAKKIKMDNEKEGFPITAIREIKILSALANAQEEIQETPLRNNVITLREIVRSGAATANDGKGSIYMIFDYMDHDLAGLLERQTLNNSKFIMPQTKCYVRQLLFGLALLQHKKVLHRDLKNANLLVNNSGELKIADFGLARYCQRSAPGQEAQGKMTNRVITLWYRPPELFLGSEHYGSEIDIWSAGCIMAELLMGKALFPGRDDADQAEKIFAIMGQPTEMTMPGCTKYQHYKLFNINNFPTRSKLRSHLESRGIKDLLALELLEKLLCLDPKKRIDAQNAAMHDWFFHSPKPLVPSEMPKYEPSHEMGMKRRRQEAARGQYQQQGQQGPPAQRQRTHGQYGGPQQQPQQHQPPAPTAQGPYGPPGRQGAPSHYPTGAPGPSRGGAAVPAAPAAAAAAMGGGAMHVPYSAAVAAPLPGVPTDPMRMVQQQQQPAMMMPLQGQRGGQFRPAMGVIPAVITAAAYGAYSAQMVQQAHGGYISPQAQQPQGAGSYGTGRGPAPGQQGWQTQRR